MDTPKPLARGDIVRIRREPEDEWVFGVVVIASSPGTPQQSVAVYLSDGLRLPDGGQVAGIVPFVADWENGGFFDLGGNDYEVHVRTEIAGVTDTVQ